LNTCARSFVERKTTLPRGPQPEVLLPSYRAVAETTLHKKTTAKAAALPEIQAVVDRIAPIPTDPAPMPREYRQTSEPIGRRVSRRTA
jgi:hypothetical protein